MVTVSQTSELRLLWTLESIPYAVNVLHFRNVSVDVDQDLADDLAANVASVFESSNLADYVSTHVELSQAGVRDLRTADLPEFLGSVSNAGSGAGDIMPPSTSLCVTLRTAKAGPRFRGRVYLPGFVEAANTEGGIALLDARDAGVAFLSSLSAAINGMSLGLGGLVVTTFKVPESNDVIGFSSRTPVWTRQKRRAGYTIA